MLKNILGKHKYKYSKIDQRGVSIILFRIQNNQDTKLIEFGNVLKFKFKYRGIKSVYSLFVENMQYLVLYLNTNM